MKINGTVSFIIVQNIYPETHCRTLITAAEEFQSNRLRRNDYILKSYKRGKAAITRPITIQE